MQNFFGVEVDTANMTLAELKGAREKIEKMLASINWQIAQKERVEHIFSESQAE